MQHETTYLAIQAKRSALFDGIGIESLSALCACLGVKRRRLEKGDALMRSKLGLITSRKSHFTLRRTV